MKILVIEALGLHLGYLGCYGNEWVATPNLDSLAVDGITFDWHFVDQPELNAVSAWSERSVGTGRYARPGQTATATDLPITPRIVRSTSLATFADDVRKELAANDPWLWIEGPGLLPPWTLDDEMLGRYFDEDEAVEGVTPWRDPLLETTALDDAGVLRLQNTYAAAVTCFDTQLGELLDHLDDDVLLCVTARSGLPLGEHGMIGTPRPLLHDELVHVPLLIRLPDGAHEGLRIGALTQPIDLLPSFLIALGHPAPLIHGQSLWPLVRGDVAELRSYAVSMMRVGDEERWLMRTLESSLHVAASPRTDAEEVKPQLFLKPEDRWEVNDLYQQQTEWAEAMEKALRTFEVGISEPGPMVYPKIEE